MSDAPPLMPESVQEFLKEPVFAHLATINEDGSPRVSTMWVDTDGRHIILNSPLSTDKVANVRRDARVALDIVPQGYPTRALWIRGRVAAMSEEGSKEQIEAVGYKYRGESYKVRHKIEDRILLYIVPEVMEGTGLDGVDVPPFFKVLRRPGVE